MKLKITGMIGAFALSVFVLTSPALSAAPEAELTYVNCWFEPPESPEVFCGWLQAPESRTDGNNNRVVRMPVVILEGIAGGHGPFAVVLGGGGPGGGLGLDNRESIAGWDGYRREVLGDVGNLVLMDQRGAGMSKPRLACPDFEISDEEYLSSAVTLDDDLRISRRESEGCAKQFADWGIDLSSYTTAASADDYDDLRRLLRGDRWWHVIGVSYGTRLAFELVRRHPDGVGGVVMSGVVPPEASTFSPRAPSASALSKIADACDEDDFCRTNYGDLRANLEAAADRLEQAPTVMAVPHPYQDYEEVTVTINPNRLADVISFGMYGEVGVALIPCVAWELSGGQECRFVRHGEEFSGLLWLAHQYAAEILDNQFGDALLSAIACRERGAPRPDAAAKGFPFNLWAEWDARHVSICDDIWAKEGKTPEAQAPVATEKPILMLTGFFDPATPPEWANAAASRLPNAQVYQLPTSHWTEDLEQCQNELIWQFLASPFEKVDDACVQHAEALPFY